MIFLCLTQPPPDLIKHPKNNTTSETKLTDIMHNCANMIHASLVPRLSRRVNEKSKERREPGKIYPVRNVIGGKNLITRGRTNELAHVLWTEYTRSVAIDSFTADRMGLDGIILHYYCSTESCGERTQTRTFENHAITCSLTWQTDRCTPRRMAFKALLNAKTAFS